MAHALCLQGDFNERKPAEPFTLSVDTLDAVNQYSAAGALGNAHLTC
jgi:hypothetical protein